MCTLHKVGGEVSKGRRVLRIARNKLKTIDLMLNRYPYCIPCAKNNQRVGMRSLLKKLTVVGVVRVIPIQIQIQGWGRGLSKNRR